MIPEEKFHKEHQRAHIASLEKELAAAAARTRDTESLHQEQEARIVELEDRCAQLEIRLYEEEAARRELEGQLQLARYKVMDKLNYYVKKHAPWLHNLAKNTMLTTWRQRKTQSEMVAEREAPQAARFELPRSWDAADRKLNVLQQPPSAEEVSRAALLTPSGAPFGINLAGFLDSEKGVGEAARCVLRALDTAGLSHVANTLHDTGSVNLIHSVRHSDQNPYSVNLIHVNAEQLPEFAKQRGPYLKGKYNIGYWNWELLWFPPQWRGGFRFLNEVWVPSRFTQQSVASISPIPVSVVPLCIHPDPPISSEWTRARFGLKPENFVFLYFFDFQSLIGRKNPLGVVSAFRAAFGGRHDVTLCIKGSHARAAPAAHAELRTACESACNMKLLNIVLPREAVNALMAASDCYVSLHRSEGFGLTLSESMFLGKPVIATAYSGNTDFMSPDNSFLVRYKLIEIERDHGPYRKGAMWADPDLGHAAELMRYVFENREASARVAARGHDDVIRQLHPETVGHIIRERLNKALPPPYRPVDASALEVEVTAALRSPANLRHRSASPGSAEAS